MARLLILGDALPNDISNGLHLRVRNLCAELTRDHECFFVGPGADDSVDGEVAALFDGFFFLKPIPRNGRSIRRHIRLSDEHFLRTAYPAYFESVHEELSRIIADNQIDALLVFAPALSAIGALAAVPKVLDFADSDSLTIRRQMDNRGCAMTLKDRSRSRLNLLRQTGRERGLIRSYDMTTTISEVDRQALLRSSGVHGDRVVIVPNGVSSDAFGNSPRRAPHGRTIIFWGNLDFPPNWTAVRYFFDEVFLPFLSSENVVWNIVGRGHCGALEAKVRHPNIHFHGFLPDLFTFAASQGVMINPMVEGSGLKNKVLESLAIGLPVVSTPLGVDAIAGGEPGKHYCVTDSPADFAAQILNLIDDNSLREKIIASGRALVQDHYTWRKVGSNYSRLVESVIGSDSGLARDTA